MGKPSIFLSAGDPSGDIAAGRLIEALKTITGDLDLVGLGGLAMQQQGQRQFAQGKELAVIGFWEVARRWLFFYRLMKQCVDEITRNRPSVVVLVDYPGFNLRLARKVEKLGIPIVYYISPQIWAWGKGRLSEIKQLIKKMILILPFEQDFYKDTGVNYQFVGHYLLEDIPEEYIQSKAPKGVNPVLGLLPGSRPQEIERMLPVMLQAAHRFNKKYGATVKVAGISGTYDYEQALSRYPGSNISIVYDNARSVIRDSTHVVTASGTATLETAIIGRPAVVIYRTGFITYLIARNLVKLDSIALANLVMGKKVLPELIQGDATPGNIFKELDKFINDSSYITSMQNELATVPGVLGGKGASLRAARLIQEYL